MVFGLSAVYVHITRIMKVTLVMRPVDGFTGTVFQMFNILIIKQIRLYLVTVLDETLRDTKVITVHLDGDLNHYNPFINHNLMFSYLTHVYWAVYLFLGK